MEGRWLVQAKEMAKGAGHGGDASGGGLGFHQRFRRKHDTLDLTALRAMAVGMGVVVVLS